MRQSLTTWKLRTTKPSNVSVRFTPEAINMLPDCRCVLPIVAFRIAVCHSSDPVPPSHVNGGSREQAAREHSSESCSDFVTKPIIVLRSCRLLSIVSLAADIPMLLKGAVQVSHLLKFVEAAIGATMSQR